MPNEASGGAAAASAWLIDTLVAMLHQRALLSTPEGKHCGAASCLHPAPRSNPSKLRLAPCSSFTHQVSK